MIKNLINLLLSTLELGLSFDNSSQVNYEKIFATNFNEKLATYSQLMRIMKKVNVNS